MANISTGLNEESNFVNLKEMNTNDIRKEFYEFLMENEHIVQCFKTIRDQVVFTDKRVFVINVKGISGKKIAYFSYPYSKVLYFGVETAGMGDPDSELIMTFANGAYLGFDFKSDADIKKICSNIQKYIL